MSRVRLINPAAPKDEAVARCSIPARLAWAYLPCHADKLGRLADKPLTLRFEIFPADPAIDMSALLAELARAELIVRYQVGGRRYIQIRSFARHQRPHKNEGDSVIPPCPEPSGNYASEPAQLSKCPERSGDPDPDPVSDPVTDPIGDLPACADPAGDSRARAISEPGLEPEPERTYHHAVARYRAPPTWTAQKILERFSAIRSEVERKDLPWDTPSEKAYAKAADLVERIAEKPDHQADIEPTMRRYLLSVRGSTRPEERRVSWLFACWHSRFDDLRGELRDGGQQPLLAGLTDKEHKNIANTQLWLAMKKQQEVTP